MRVWEAHRMLSAAIGDTVVCNAATVPPDGVRYTRLMRDGYMYRAMLFYIKKASQVISGKSRRVAGAILTPVFSDMIKQADVTAALIGSGPRLREYAASLSALTPPPVWIFSALASIEPSSLMHTYVPIPVRDHSDINALLNSRNVQAIDAFCSMYSHPSASPQLRIYTGGENISTNIGIRLTYLPYPVDPASQSGSVPRLTETLGQFQLSLLGDVIGLATLYAKMDDQESDSLERFAPQLLETEIANNINVGGNPAQ